MRLICLLPVLTLAAITCRDSAPPVPHTRRGPVSVLLEFVPNDSAPQVGSPRVRFALRRGSAVLGQDHRAVNVDSLRVGDVCLVWTFPRELHYDRPIEPVTIDVVSIVRLNGGMPRPRGSRPAA
jgi:hypothetical protein